MSEQTWLKQKRMPLYDCHLTSGMRTKRKKKLVLILHINALVLIELPSYHTLPIPLLRNTGKLIPSTQRHRTKRGNGRQPLRLCQLPGGEGWGAGDKS
jgi:hypothetical protein